MNERVRRARRNETDTMSAVERLTDVPKTDPNIDNGPESRIGRMSLLGLGCVETRDDPSSRLGFTPLRRFWADFDRISGFSACRRFWRASVRQNGDLSRRCAISG